MFNKKIIEWHLWMMCGVPLLTEALKTNEVYLPQKHGKWAILPPKWLIFVFFDRGNFFLKGRFWLEVGKGLVVNTRWFGWNIAMLTCMVFVHKKSVIRWSVENIWSKTPTAWGPPLGASTSPLPNLLRFGMGWTLKTYLKSTKRPSGGMKLLDG